MESSRLSTLTGGNTTAGELTIVFTARIRDGRGDNSDAGSNFQIQVGGMIGCVEIGWFPRHESTL